LRSREVFGHSSRDFVNREMAWRHVCDVSFDCRCKYVEKHARVGFLNGIRILTPMQNAAELAGNAISPPVHTHHSIRRVDSLPPTLGMVVRQNFWPD